MNTFEKNAYSIFCRALQLDSADDRTAFLDTSCNGDTRLRRRVEKLLDARPQACGFLEMPALARELYPEGTASSEEPGTIIGQYKLIEEIGHGGFGTVYRAEQTKPIRRTVALKILRPGMDTKQVIARFNAERQAMAIMDHPNIARMLDAGSTGAGRPYFVMELVEGQRITEFCDAEKLSIHGRLRLFAAVCDAIHHAHGRGVVHRDIKPSNVLVTKQGQNPVPMVIDFGIAKATHEPLTDESIITRDGQLIGTPQYMSPEQADLSPMDIGPRSDIYSLGVLLYELITGTTPIAPEQLKAAGIEKMRQIVREEEPLRPSVVHRRSRSFSAIEGQHGAAPGEYRRLVAVDLDWIVLKALEKDPARRYSTAEHFSSDVKCFLESKPVRARRPTFGYRFSKWSYRHQAILAVGVIAVMAISVALMIGYLKESAARRKLAANLYETLVSEVRASRLARTEGFREQAIGNLQRARQLSTHTVDVVELRREAVECMGDFLGFRSDVLDGFPIPIEATAMNPISAEIALGFSNGSVLIYGLTSPDQIEQITELHEHPGRITALAYAPDGRTLISGHDQGTIQVWQRGSPGGWALSRAIKTDNSCVTWSLAVTGDGSQFGALLIEDRPAHALKRKVPDRVQMWNLKDGVESKEFGNADWMFQGTMAFSPDGRMLVTGHTSFTERGFHVWDVSSRKVLRSVKTSSSRVIQFAFSPDSAFLGCALQDGFAVFETEQFTRRTFGRGTKASWIAFSADNRLLAVGTMSGRPAIELWSVPANRLLAVVPQASSDRTPLIGGAFTSNGRLLVSTTPGSVRVWDLEAATEKRVLPGHEAGINSVSFSRDGKLLASAGDDNAVRIWSTSTGRMVTTLNDYQRPVSTVAFSPDGKLIASGGREILIRSADSYRKLAILQPEFPPVQVWDVEFGPSGNYLAASCEFGLAVWRIRLEPDNEGDSKPFRFELVGSVGDKMSHACCFSPDGKRLAFSTSGSTGKSIHIFDVGNGRPLAIRGPRLAEAGPPSIQFHRDGRQIVFAAPGNVVKSWNVVTGDRSSVAEQTFSGMCLTLDGRLLAARGPGSRAKVSVWDYETATRLFSLPDVGAAAEAFAWSPDATMLAVGMADGRLSIWSIPQILAKLAEIGLNW